MRYDTTIARDFFKTLDALQKLQRTRRLLKENEQACREGPRSASQTAIAPLSFAAAAGSQMSENGIRSVSQNSALTPDRNEQKELTVQSGEKENVLAIETPNSPSTRSAICSIDSRSTSQITPDKTQPAASTSAATPQGRLATVARRS